MPTDRDLIAEGKAIDAALTPGLWYSCLNDMIGGRCIQTADVPASQAEPGAAVVDMVLRDEDARLIARMRNLFPLILERLAEMEAQVESDRAKAAAAVLAMECRVAELEAAQRPPLGYPTPDEVAELRAATLFSYEAGEPPKVVNSDWVRGVVSQADGGLVDVIDTLARVLAEVREAQP
ncbi:hypothetical protein [Nocardia vulneris]|uniref:Uncharacterized protein n=1 Tax=Nocardia vulneris TaxID=1141657 RepID=A0ABR4ZCI9_9NOCA|nr:hypothetical protein [Nocardia vulneris]KIA63025.1 hypothetical protein FG87_21925 [Nocardia vulneris]